MRLRILPRDAPGWLAVAGLLVGATYPQSWAATLRVPSDYPTIQDGIDASAFGDTVLVAPGVYTEFETRGNTTACAFLKDGVTLMSEDGPTVTTIDLIDISGPQATGLVVTGLPGGPTTVDGFTIDGRDRSLGAFISSSEDVTVRNCHFRNYEGGPVVGGAVIVNGDASIVDCEFVNCKANAGGAVWHTFGHLDFIGCIVTGCHDSPVYADESQGAPPVSLTILDCQFIDNTSDGGAGGLLVGKALGGTTIRGCLFWNNVNTGTGGGGMSLALGPKTVEECIFIENGAIGDNGQGGAISSGATPLIARNNVRGELQD